MFDALHIVGNRAFELRAEAFTVYKVRTYTLTEDCVELNPTELEFPTRDLAEVYIEIMKSRFEGGENDE